MAGEGDKLVIIGVLVGCNGGLLNGAHELAFCEKAFQNAIDVVFKFLNLIESL
jgi:hypothetical protein